MKLCHELARKNRRMQVDVITAHYASHIYACIHTTTKM